MFNKRNYRSFIVISFGLLVYGIAGQEVAVVFTESTYEFPENQGSASIGVTLTGMTNPLEKSITVSISVLQGSAELSKDYGASSGSVTFNVGDLNVVRFVTVPILEDTLYEGPETFTLALIDSSVVDIGTPGQTTVTITDNDNVLIGFSPTSYNVDEGDIATVTVMVLSGQLGTQVTVSVQTTGASASDQDFTDGSTDLTFSAAQTTRTFNVLTVEDTVVEETETIIATLGSQSGITSTNNAVISIQDDDSLVVEFKDATQQVSEGDGFVNIEITATGTTAIPLSLSFTTQDVTAFAGSDYSSTTQTVTFGAGSTKENAVVLILENLSIEAPETFLGKLTAISSRVTIGAVGTTEITIVDNDFVDECQKQNTPCVQNAQCLSNNGSHFCICNVGFSGDGYKACKVLDECQKQNTPCVQNARCLSNNGSHFCICNVGFSGDGYKTCEDIAIYLEQNYCTQHYQKAISPNRFGDQTFKEMESRFFSFYPLVYTFCSNELKTFLCPAIFPRAGLPPCRSVCERVRARCNYAIQRSQFYWPPELDCGLFDDDKTCYDVSDGIITGEHQEFQQDPTLCGGPGTQNIICNMVNTLGSTPYNDSRRNYFNHISKDVARYELSTFLPLVSTLWISDRSQNCPKLLSTLLCHLYLPSCIGVTKLRTDTCATALDKFGVCNDTMHRYNNQGMDMKWPLSTVNCKNPKWFSSNLTETIYLNNSPFPLAPPPTQFDVTRTSITLSVRFQPQLFGDGIALDVAVLYRKYGGRKSYIFKRADGNIVLIKNLEPGVKYEILLGSLSGILSEIVTELGPFARIVEQTYGQCPNDVTGDKVLQGEFFWKELSHGMSMSVDCPYGYIDPDINYEQDPPWRVCKCNDIACKWSEPYNLEACNYKVLNSTASTAIFEIIQDYIKGEASTVEISDKLVNLTTQYASNFTEDDVDLTVIALEHIVQDIDYLNETGSNIVKTVNNILDVGPDILSISQQFSKMSTRTLVVLDRYLENVVLPADTVVSQNEVNIAVSSQVFDDGFEGAAVESGKSSFFVYNDDKSINPVDAKATLTLPESLFQKAGIDSKANPQRVHFVLYRKTSLFQSLKNVTEKTKNVTKNSYVIAGSVKGQKLRNLEDPIVSTYYPLRDGLDESTACVFWNFNDNNGFGGWSESGCTYQGTENKLVTCHCDHLTNFAILMDVNIDEKIGSDHEQALSIVSYIGCAISLLGLILTIITILLIKDLRNKSPSQILLNFCIALGLTLLVFLIGAERDRVSSMTGCRVSAIALHYFVLATFMWMALEAFNMYLAFVKVIPKHISHFTLKCCAVGWGLPVVIVAITAAVAIDEYGDDRFCRVKGLPFYIAFLAPVLVILLANTIAFVVIIRSLVTSGRQVAADRRASGLTHARRGLAILVVLGLTWLFGILAINSAKLFFQYLFCIFNSLQGLFVFVFYCLLSKDTRKKMKNFCCKSKKGNMTVIAGHTGTNSKSNETNEKYSKSNTKTTTM